jgi:hypothetical protein
VRQIRSICQILDFNAVNVSRYASILGGKSIASPLAESAFVGVFGLL